VGIWAFSMTLKTNSDAMAVINPPRIDVFHDWGSTTFNNSVIRRKVLIRNPSFPTDNVYAIAAPVMMTMFHQRTRSFRTVTPLDLVDCLA